MKCSIPIESKLRSEKRSLRHSAGAEVIRCRLPENFSYWPEPMRRRFLAVVAAGG
jgi:hypothetical protein